LSNSCRCFGRNDSITKLDKPHLLPRREEVTPLKHAISLDTEAQRTDGWERLIRYGAEPLLTTALPLIQNLFDALLCLPNSYVITGCGQTVVATLYTGMQGHHGRHSCAADSVALPVKYHIRAAMLLSELHPDTLDW